MKDEIRRIMTGDDKNNDNDHNNIDNHNKNKQKLD